MQLEETYFYAALTLCLGCFLTALVYSLWSVWKLKARTFSFRPAGVLVSTALVNLVLFLGVLMGLRSQWLLRGDELQNAVGVLLLILGFISGAWMAMRLHRVAFREALWLVAIFLALPLWRTEQLAELMGFQVSTAYFATVLFAGSCLLFFSLLVGGSVGYLIGGDGKLVFSFDYESFIGRRFLMTKKGARVVSLITVISIFAVMVGTGGMIVVMSVMNGFSSDLRSKIMGTNAHLLIMRFGNDFSEYPEALSRIEKIPAITGSSPFILNEVMVSSQDNLSGAIVKGIDPARVGQVTTLPETILDGSIDYLEDPKELPSLSSRNKDIQKGQFRSETETLDKLKRTHQQTKNQADQLLPGIIIGSEMARSLRVFVGDVVNVISPLGELGPSGPIPKSKAFRVVAVFHSGMFEYDSKFAYLALKEAQQFFGMKKSVTGIECRVDNFENTPAIARTVSKALGGYPYYTKDWMQMNTSIFSALKLEKIAMFIILMTLIFMASLLILVSLIIVVIEKGKEIAILKSMGATDASIMKIFVTYGVSVGSFGAALGLLLGLGICFLLAKFGIGLDAQVYYISSLPVKVDPYEVGAVALSALVISFLATVPPALYAARLQPLEGLRYE